MKRIVLSGATGLIGHALAESLVARGDEVIAWVRDVDKARRTLGDRVTLVAAANLEDPGPWRDAMAGADAVVHLAGEPIAGGRWNARRKQQIRDSRVESTRVIVEGLAGLPAERRPKALIVASGADYYDFADPMFGDEDPVTEDHAAGVSFLARVCKSWEQEAADAEPLGVRVARLRTGVVIADGGALAKMTTPFKLFVGGRIGSGRQWFSWIHKDDAVAVYRTAIDDERYRGPINLVAGSVRNKDLARYLGDALHRPSWLPVPALALKVAVGELSEYLLQGRNVVPAKLDALGYRFVHPKLPEALASAV